MDHYLDIIRRKTAAMFSGCGRIASLLWDRSGEAQSRNSLRQALHELTLALAPDVASIVEVDRETIALVLDRCRIDVRELVVHGAPALAGR